MHDQAIDITSLLWLALLEGEGKTQMRRMLKEAADAEGGDGGLLYELHVLGRSGIRNSAVISRTTRPLSTTVTCGTTFLERARRSAVTQSGWHDCDSNSGLIASTLRRFMAE